MKTSQPTSKHNPLANFMRQPKIYISLPSEGKYWNPKSLEINDTNEYPVYSMTARDELLFKTPDALMNGQAVVDVIHSCVPNIKNAWDCPTLDLDTILIALRFATYGKNMNFTHKIPVIDEEIDYEIDLRLVLDKQQQNQWIEEVYINENMSVFVKPLTFRHVNKASLKGFETQRILQLANDDSVSDDKKLEMFSNSFKTLTDVTISMMNDCVYKIVISNDEETNEVTDIRFIKEFINNTDKDVFKQIQDHLTELKTLNELKPMEFTTTEEQQAQGAPETYTVPLSFNNSDFFA
jgi:hypothetical protein